VAPEPPSRLVLSWEACARVYADEVRPSMGLKATSLTRSKGIGLELAKMVKDHGEGEVIEVLRWVAVASDDRPGGADFHRSRQSGLDTLRRHFDRYLDMARNVPKRTTNARASPPPQAPRGRHSGLTPEDEAANEAAYELLMREQAEKGARNAGAR
jgi:hypothetical protein